MKLLSASLATIFLFTQTVALAEGTKSTLQIVTLDQLIDQNLGAVEQAEAADVAVESQLTTKQQRKADKWEAKLNRVLPKFNQKIAETYAAATEEELNARLIELKTDSAHEGKVEQVAALEKIQSLSVDQKRTEMTSLSQAAVVTLLPTIAHDIGAAGGAAKYLLKAKKGGSDFGFTNKYAKIFCIILGVILILCAFGCPVVLYLILLGALMTVGIMSAFSPHDKGSYRFR